MDSNKHKFFLFNILKDIYSDVELANSLGFKGGTALMFFYDLPRFSVDLDFNLIGQEKEQKVYEKVRKIILAYGNVHDEALKFYGSIVVLNYGKEERKLKVEISNRDFDDHYEVKNLLGINVKVMVAADMFAHKLCALLDRKAMTNRDIFDCWFFMKNRTPLNPNIIQTRMKIPVEKYLERCVLKLEERTNTNLLQGIGELVDEDMKGFVRKDLRNEVVRLLKFYRKFPIIER